MAGVALRSPFFVPSQETSAPAAEEEKERAARNEAYLAEIERRVANIESGHWTEHELIEVEDG